MYALHCEDCKHDGDDCECDSCLTTHFSDNLVRQLLGAAHDCFTVNEKSKFHVLLHQVGVCLVFKAAQLGVIFSSQSVTVIYVNNKRIQGEVICTLCELFSLVGSIGVNE